MNEARLEDFGSGLAPAEDGWFVVNVRDAEWWTSKTFGAGCGFETREHERYFGYVTAVREALRRHEASDEGPDPTEIQQIRAEGLA